MCVCALCIVLQSGLNAKWHPATDHLSGRDAYGTYNLEPSAAEAWSIPFAELPYDYVCVSTGDAKHFAVFPRYVWCCCVAVPCCAMLCDS